MLSNAGFLFNFIVETKMHDILQNLEVNTLSAEDSKAIEGPMKYEEALHVLKAMSNNRSPGSDLSAELFKKSFEKKFILLYVQSMIVLQKVVQLFKGKEL